jgi:hypothetical protein
MSGNRRRKICPTCLQKRGTGKISVPPTQVGQVFGWVPLAFSMSRRRGTPVGSLSAQSMARWRHGEHCHSATGSASGPAAQARPISPFLYCLPNAARVGYDTGSGTRGASADSEPERDPAWSCGLRQCGAVDSHSVELSLTQLEARGQPWIGERPGKPCGPGPCAD